MIKTKTVETVEEFDKDGCLLRRTVTETNETNDDPARIVASSTITQWTHETSDTAASSGENRDRDEVT